MIITLHSASFQHAIDRAVGFQIDGYRLIAVRPHGFILEKLGTTVLVAGRKVSS